MNWNDAATIDFETLPIEDRPHYPPPPVGVAIKLGTKRGRYYAFGHLDHNNSTWDEVRSVLRELYASRRPLLFHNAKFDIDVAEAHLGIKRLPWQRYHDTLLMLFLRDPRAPTFSLKPSAVELLDWKQEERDAVEDWLIQHQPLKHITKITKTNAGAYIGLAPAKLVDPYAVGDVDRTFKLAQLVYRQVEQRGMVAAYDMERELMLHVLDMERHGVRIDAKRLDRDVRRSRKAIEDVEAWLRKRLKTPDDINFGSGDQLAAALINARVAKAKDLGVTETGKTQTSKDALKRGVSDRQVLAMLQYRARLNKNLSTFMEPWLRTAKQSGGRIYTTWNSTRRDKSDGGTAGARTGRFSSTPNFQNLTVKDETIFDKAAPAPIKLPPIPKVRSYVLPDEGHKLIGRDFDGQELRMLAHFENDTLLREYNDDPKLDLHQMVADALVDAGHNTTRKKAKTINFAIIYGVGLGHLAEMLDCSVEEAKAQRDAYYQIFPSIRELMTEATERWKTGGSIRTLGSREYFCEEPKWVHGKRREFSYKALNLLIQGSSADLTKMAVLDFLRKKPKAHLLLMVHDELVVSAPKATWRSVMAELRKAMNKKRIDVPMLSSGYVGDNWSGLKPCD